MCRTMLIRVHKGKGFIPASERQFFFPPTNSPDGDGILLIINKIIIITSGHRTKLCKLSLDRNGEW